MAKPRIPLTKARQAYAKSRDGAVFFGGPLNHPWRVEDRYATTLKRLVAIMAAETERALRKTWAAHDVRPAVTSGMDASLASQTRILTNALALRFRVLFGQLAPLLAARVVRGVDTASKSALHASLKEASGGLSLKTSVMDARTAELTKAATVQNVALIKSVPEEYFGKVQGAVMRAIQAGGDASQVMRAVEHTGEVTKKRADLIARDQTSKAFTALNKARLQKLGCKKFGWLHSAGGKEPRQLHVDMSGQVFSFDDPPVIDDKTGERGLPGQLINCRCRMTTVIDFGGPASG